MKSLGISPTNIYLVTAFSEWLDTLGYAKQTLYSAPFMVRELLHFLEKNKVENVKQIDDKHITEYYKHLKQRTNKRNKSGSLSNAHLNKHQQAIKLFLRFMRQSGRIMLAYPSLDSEKEDTKPTQVLTKEEAKQLFEATYINSSRPELHHLLLRDRAMLAVYYLCGLRRNEGLQLDLRDIDFDNNRLHVRKGKNYKQRLVPLDGLSKEYLNDYIYDSRGKLLDGTKTTALFISMRKKRMDGQSMLLRLKCTQSKCDSKVLRDKVIGLHTLRHSIATHLLANGMELELIRRFLGHSSLESTQTYTHLLDNK